MAKIKKAITATLTVGLTLLMMAGCGGGQEKKGAERKAERRAERKAERRAEKRAEMGPEGTVEAFCRAVAGGDFAAAKALCDTVAMNGYLERYAEALDAQVRRDSGAVAIAAAELAKTVFTVDDIVRDGESRHVHYTICAGEGMSKKKTATVKKIE